MAANLDQNSTAETDSGEILIDVPEVIQRARQMKDFAEEMRIVASETTARANELRRDAAAQFKTARALTQSLKTQMENDA